MKSIAHERIQSNDLKISDFETVEKKATQHAPRYARLFMWYNNKESHK